MLVTPRRAVTISACIVGNDNRISKYRMRAWSQGSILHITGVHFTGVDYLWPIKWPPIWLMWARDALSWYASFNARRLTSNNRCAHAAMSKMYLPTSTNTSKANVSSFVLMHFIVLVSFAVVLGTIVFGLGEFRVAMITYPVKNVRKNKNKDSLR